MNKTILEKLHEYEFPLRIETKAQIRDIENGGKLIEPTLENLFDELANRISNIESGGGEKSSWKWSVHLFAKTYAYPRFIGGQTLKDALAKAWLLDKHHFNYDEWVLTSPTKAKE